MKKFNIRRYGILFILPLLLFSCNDWIDTDLNIDPDQPSDVPMEYLLPSIQGSMGYVIGGNTAVRTTNIWMQYFDGVDRQSLAEARYNITSSDVNDLWENLYSQAMMDCKALITKAELASSPHYAGVAKVCLATCMGTLTNLFGDMPYTEAFLGGEGNLQPIYESQQAIYGHIETLLAEAIVDLSSEENAVDLSSDLIYGDYGANENYAGYANQLNNWILTANALLARYSLYQGDYTAALGYVNSSFTSSLNNFRVRFETPGGENPIYQFMEQRTDIRMSSTFVDELIDTGDPRLSFYVGIDLAGGYSGSNPGGEVSAASHPGSFCNSGDAPVYLATYTEMLFIAAECNLELNNGAEALAAYQAGITSSCMDVAGAIDSTYQADFIDNVTSVNLGNVIGQKYKAMFATVMPYDDWRRTGFPALAPVIGATQATPVRYPYAQSEITYNGNCPVGVQVSDKLWIFQ